MEKPITIIIEDAREFGIILEMLQRDYISSMDNNKGKCKITLTTQGRKFLNKLINPIKQNGGK